MSIKLHLPWIKLEPSKAKLHKNAPISKPSKLISLLSMAKEEIFQNRNSQISEPH